MRKLASVLAMLASTTFHPLVAQVDHSAHSDRQQPEKASTDVRIGDPWPLDTCVVSGEKLGSMGDPVIRLHEGREVRFCCSGCVSMFESDPATYLKEADEKITEQQKAIYPLDHCIIDTAEALSADEGENAYSVVGNRLFVYCCPPCDEKVRQDPSKYIEILNQAVIEKQKADYTLTTCVISGQPLDAMGGAVDRVIAGRLVRLCCAGCNAKLEANPAAALAKIPQPRQDAQSKQIE
jgi:YHS domain-containing protein